MAIAFRASDGAGVTGTSLTITKPAGTIDGDVMIAVICARSSGAVTCTPPSGWTEVIGVDRLSASSTVIGRMFVYRKVAASEGANYGFTISQNSQHLGEILTFSGVDTTTPIDGTPQGNNSTAASTETAHVTPDMTTTVANAEVVRAAHGLRGGTAGAYSWPTSTERSDRGYYDSGANIGSWVSAATATKATAGATGTETATSSQSARWCAATFALTPASSGTSETPTPGGAVAAGNAPTATATVAVGGADAAGPSPTASSSVAAGGADAQGTSPTAGAAVPQGGADAAGTGPTASTTVAAGGAEAAGTGPTAQAPASAGGATAQGNAPSPAASVTSGGAVAGGNDPSATATGTPTPGGATAAGNAPSVLVSLTVAGGDAGGNAPTAVVSVSPGGAVAGGVGPTGEADFSYNGVDSFTYNGVASATYGGTAVYSYGGTAGFTYSGTDSFTYGG